jgi:rubrerythrin
MVGIPVRKAGEKSTELPAESQKPILTWDEYEAMRKQFETIKAQEYEHFRKLIAIQNPKPPEDIFDLFDKIMNITEKLNNNNNTKSESSIKNIFDIINALSKLDPNKIGEVLEKLGSVIKNMNKPQNTS